MNASSGTPGARNAGLTLLEVLIAVVIISIAASIIVITSRTAVTGQQRSKVYGDASSATKEVLEAIQQVSLDSVKKLNNSVMSHSQGSSITVRATSRRLVDSDVEDINDLDTSTLRHITLHTRFLRKASGDTTTKTFTTIIYKP